MVKRMISPQKFSYIIKLSKIYVFINFDKNTAQFKSSFWKKRKLFFFLQVGPVPYWLVVAPYWILGHNYFTEYNR